MKYSTPFISLYFSFYPHTFLIQKKNNYFDKFNIINNYVIVNSFSIKLILFSVLNISFYFFPFEKSRALSDIPKLSSEN